MIKTDEVVEGDNDPGTGKTTAASDKENRLC